MFKEICINNKPCELMKAINHPEYGSKTVLTDSAWEYVSLFLKRRSSAGVGDTVFYWEQAHSFYLASQSLPDNAKPLTSYYCILNASKALLRFYGVGDEQLTHHGVSSHHTSGEKTDLKKAATKIKGGGVLPELSKFFDCKLTPKEYCIFDLLYNIPCVHRAFCITYKQPELFIPIYHPVMVKKDQSTEAWMKFDVDSKYSSASIAKSFPNKFEHDEGIESQYVLRMKKRFNWDRHSDIKLRKAKLVNHHKKVRRHIYYIFGDSKLWYLKRKRTGNEEMEEVPSMVLIFCVFHWLSELVRYDPRMFQKYMKSKQNWLLHEFINKGLEQFVDEVSCEITGKDIMCTGYRK